MPQVHLQLLGDFCLTYTGKPLVGLDTPRLRALVAYLALHSHAPQMRHHLAFVFWPDSSEEQALTNLRKQLLYLRNRLPDSATLLQVERQTIQWRPAGGFGADVTDFEEYLARAAGATGEQAIDLLRCAVDLYHGELLPECYDEWIFPKREALREQFAGGLARLVQLFEDRRDYPAAIDYAQRLLRHDSLHEPTYRGMMRLYALNGNRAAALRVYHTCVTQLREELGVEPQAETQAAYERLLSQAPPVELHRPALADVPLVGRQPEWQRLQQAWRQAMRHHPQFAVIAGEAGIGKSRLAEEFLAWAAHQGFVVAHTRCYAAEGRLAYTPVIELLRADALRPHRRRLQASWLTEVARLMPELMAEEPALPRPEPVSQSWQRRHLFEALARAVLAGDKPLVLLMDDLQWCDQDTLEWLHFLLRFAPGVESQSHRQAQLLVIGTTRGEEIDAGHPLAALLANLRGGDQLTEIDLAPLSAAETVELANSVRGEVLETGAASQLYRSTEGNPLFVVESMRRDQWQAALGSSVARPGDGGDHTLPPKIQAVIESRLAQLSPQARQVAALAAIIGREFTIEVLAAASQDQGHDLIDALDELWQRRIIREQGFHAYDFSHDRIREVAAATVSTARRRLLHRSAGEALATVYAATLDIVAAQIAAHFEQAGLAQKAVDFYQMAADVALRVYANHEAIGHLQQALALLSRLPAGPARDRQEIELQLTLAARLQTVMYYHAPEVEAAYQRAYKLSTRSGTYFDPAILRGMASISLMRGAHHQTTQWANELLTLAEQHGQPVNIVEAHFELGVNYFWLANFDLSLQHLEAALAHFEPQQQWEHIRRYAQDPKSICLQRLAYTQWYRGYQGAAARSLEAAIACAEELSHPFSLGYIWTFALIIFIDCGNLDRAQVLVKQVVPFLEEYDMPHWQSMVAILQGYLMTVQGQVQQGIATMREALTIFCDRGARLALPFFLGLLAQAYARAGEIDQGLAQLAEACKAVEQYDQRSYEAELYRLRGTLLLQAGMPNRMPTLEPEVEACFSRALEIAGRQNAKSMELRSAISLSRLWQTQGKSAQAKQLLASVYDWFTEAFDAPDLVEAKVLLVELEN